MKLIKTSFFTGIATLIKIIANFAISKIIAIYVGPVGLAIIGQFQNFSSIAQTFSSGAINSGVVKYIAEYYDDEVKKQKTLSTAVFICLICSIILAVGLFLFRHILSISLLNDDRYASVFTVFAVTITFFSLNSLLISVLNGERDIKKYTLVNITTSLCGLFITSGLIIYWHIFGALIALVINQSIVFFVTLALVVKSQWFKWQNFFGGVDKNHAKSLFKYTLMAIATALTVPVSQIVIRNYIGEHLTWEQAGYWQAITKISDMYLLLITSTLSVYYLPTLSSIKDRTLLKKEIFLGYKIILPSAFFLALAVYLLRQQIVSILFTQQFNPMLELFKYQLIGDVIKIGSWLLGFVTVAKAMTKIFIFSEVTFTVTYVIFSIVGINIFGLSGVVIGFAFNYFLYWLFMIFICKKEKIF